jgi:hypothetical protein
MQRLKLPLRPVHFVQDINFTHLRSCQQLLLINHPLKIHLYSNMTTLHSNEQPDGHFPRGISIVEFSNSSEPQSPLNGLQGDQPNSVFEMQNLQPEEQEESNQEQSTSSPASAIAAQEVPKEWADFLAPTICIIIGLGALGTIHPVRTILSCY